MYWVLAFPNPAGLIAATDKKWRLNILQLEPKAIRTAAQIKVSKIYCNCRLMTGWPNFKISPTRRSGTKPNLFIQANKNELALFLDSWVPENKYTWKQQRFFDYFI